MPVNRKALLLIPVAILLAVVIGFVCYAYWPVDEEEDQFMAARIRSTPAVLDARLAPAIDEFALLLHNELAKGGGNVFYSPLSISTALSMTLAGTKANTRAQLAEFLKTSDLSDELVGDSYHALFNNYNEDPTLTLANMLYSSNKYDLNDEFQQHLVYHYLATAKEVDFGENAAEVTKEINGAVEKVTKGLIKGLIPDGVLNGATALVLVNAVHFKGLWLEQFNANRTSPQDFTAIDGTVSQVPMMSQKAKFKTADHNEIGARSLSMDYKDSNFSMMIVLPNEDKSLLEVERSMVTMKTSLASLLDKAYKSEIRVMFPKFKMEYEIDLKGTLEDMGVKDLVTMGKADLSGMAGNPGDLSVSNILHKAVIEVNEEGAEAAAATAVVAMTRSGVRTYQKPFIVDRPFLFYIVDRETNVPVFAGRYVKPPTAA